MITIQNADKALKDYYLDAVSVQLNDGISPFFSAIEKNSDCVYGKDVKVAVVRGNNGSIAAGVEDGNLPAPYSNRYLDITVPLKNLYGTIEISDKALRASRDSSGAFVNLVNAEMDGLISSAKQNFQRMLFGNGTGKLFRITGNASGSTYKADAVCDYFAGMKVDIQLAIPAIKGDAVNLVITSVNKAAGTVTFDRTVSDNILNGTAYVAGSLDNELTGLGAIFENTTLYGYNKADEPFVSPLKIDGENELTEDKLVEVLDRMEECYNSKINMILCSYKMRRRIAALIANNRRVVNSVDARTGVGVVTVNDVPVYADRYCADGEIIFVNTDDFCLSQLCDWEWLEDEDGKILKQVPGKAAYTATLVKYAELICKKPCGQAKLYNLKELDGE
ncbi:MAG: phage major capsid protein [Clostridia bacterium]|nr:phage major capsid protein [Clostridia bacterium]